MLNLLISALFVTTTGTGYKLATVMKSRRLVVGALMLLMAGALVGAAGLWRGPLEVSKLTALLGVCAGVCLWLCTAAFFQVMRYGRLAVQWTVINMAVAVPVLVSMIVWGERPTPMLVTGLVTGAAALILMGVDKGATQHTDSSTRWDPRIDIRSRVRWCLLVAVSFLGTGCVQVCHKAFTLYGEPQHRLTYVWLCLTTGGALGLVTLVATRTKPTLREWGLGLYMGVSMALAMSFLISALAVLPAIVVFPLRSACAIVLTTLVCVFAWREKIRRPGIAGLVLAIIAIFCLQGG